MRVNINNPSFFLCFLLLLKNSFAASVTAEPQQCTNPQQCSNPETNANNTKHVANNYGVRDTPLHEALVQDALKELENFNDSNGKYRPRYFEGWYYKIDLPDERGTFVVIPGLYLRQEETIGFVMVLDASGSDATAPRCRFWKFPMDKITSSVDGDHDFVFRLDENNVFTAHGYTIDLPATDENPAVKGHASWTEPLALPGTRWNPTIMGWFSWLPRGSMQCSHGVVSMDHKIESGEVNIGDNKVVTLKGAQGYIEKDWGREFPQKYTWIQASDFDQAPGASFLVSVASIPVKPFENWLQFTGFLSFLRYPDPEDKGNFKTIRFATYTGAKATYNYDITQPDDPTKPRDHQVRVQLTSSQYTLTATVVGDRDHAATLWGPLPSNPSGGMRPYVREMLNCPTQVVLKRMKDGKVLFEGTAEHGGFEIEGHEEEDVVDTTEQAQAQTEL